MMLSGREGFVLAYNVQTAVDGQHRLIVHHEVTIDGADNLQLAPMAKATQGVINAEHFRVLADAGYSNGEQLAECEANGMEVIVPPNRAVNGQGDYFQKEVFRYNSAQDQFICPQGEILHYKTYSHKSKLKLYTTEACSGCSLKPKCTKAKQRWISRHFNEEVFARCEQHLLANPKLMRERASIVEAPFGSIKRMMGNGRFLCRGLRATKTEMALSVLAYNFKRVVNIVGVESLMTQLA